MFKCIVACDSMGGIGKNGTIPWESNKEDLKIFKEKTLNQIVVMGSKTWDDPAFPKPLKNRTNIVISNNQKPKADYVFGGDNWIIDMTTFLAFREELDKEIWLIGGGQLIEKNFFDISEFHVTIMNDNYECDVFIPIDKIIDRPIIGKQEYENFSHYVFKGF